MRSAVLLVSLGLSACGPGATRPIGGTTYYVDGQDGDDARAGTAPETAWRTLEQVSAAKLLPGDSVLFKRGTTLRGTLAIGLTDFSDTTGSAAAPLRFGAFGDGPRPVLLASEDASSEADWVDEGGGVWRSTRSFARDVGNVLFLDASGVVAVGVKRWTRDELRDEGDFWVDLEALRATKAAPVRLRSTLPPPARGRVELALNVPNVYIERAEAVIVEDLDLRYAGAHGVAVAEASDVTIRRCEISWTGGANNSERTPQVPNVRYGNGVQFYGTIHGGRVEGCRIHDVYDTAVTNQYAGKGALQERLVYRQNVLWNFGMAALEVWVDEGSTVRDVEFDHNTCVGAGRGWGGAQRPDVVGGHLVWWYGRNGGVSDVRVHHNLFSDAVRGHVLQGDERRWSTAQVSSDQNGFDVSGGTPLGLVFGAGGGSTPLPTLADFTARTGWDARSTELTPRFVDAAHGDFRLQADDPARALDLGAAGE